MGLYFVLVAGLAHYLRDLPRCRVVSGGRETPAWITGLSVISANLSPLEMPRRRRKRTDTVR